MMYECISFDLDPIGGIGEISWEQCNSREKGIVIVVDIMGIKGLIL